MKIQLERAPHDTLATSTLILLNFDGEKLTGIDPELYSSGEITAKPLEFTLLHQGEGSPARRILIAGAGKRDKFSTAVLRKVTAGAVRFLKAKSIKDAVFALDASLSTPENVSAAAVSALVGNQDMDLHKSDKSGSKTLETLTLAVSADGLDSALAEGIIVGEAQNFARMLGNEPPNILNPLALAAHAKAMADQYGLGYEVLDRERMAELGFGSLLGVAMGSGQPPVLIVLRYTPQTPPTEAVHLGFVGKAVTFDSGGISIKPSEGMDQMKYDMMGGACIIAAMQAIAQLKPTIPVTAVVASVENMLGDFAQRPGDIVKTLSGKTVEVLNTDAEGRMILADAITYSKQLGCTHLVDAATLTGAVVVALGHSYTGVFDNDASLRDRWMAAAAAEDEKMWPLPTDDDFKEKIKGSFADLQNIGGRWGGASIAANFLLEFVDSTPWVHLDIAGTGWIEDTKPWMVKGPTGTPTRSFVRLATSWK